MKIPTEKFQAGTDGAGREAALKSAHGGVLIGPRRISDAGFLPYQALVRTVTMTLLWGRTCGVANSSRWPVARRQHGRWPPVPGEAGKIRRIGVLVGAAESDPQIVTDLAAFKAALVQLGWIDGGNIQIEYRFAEADAERMHAIAKELVALQPDVIVVHTTPCVAALQRETGADSHRVRCRFRSRWKRICRELAAPRSQHHGVHQYRGVTERQVG